MRIHYRSTTPRHVVLSDTMHLLIRFKKSTPPQNRQLNILIRDSRQYVDGGFSGREQHRAGRHRRQIHPRPVPSPLPTPSPPPTCWAAFLSDSKYLLIRFRKSTLPQIDNLIFKLVIVDNKLMVDFLAVNNIEQEDTVGKYILAL